jgi:DNA-directed RNA polymerase subunit RPC12/RpoP
MNEELIITCPNCEHEMEIGERCPDCGYKDTTKL